jgi:hypothetical protein
VGAAERAGDIEGIAGLGVGASERAASWSGAEEDDVGEDEIGRGLGGVTAGEGSVVVLCECAETMEESVNPALTIAGSEKGAGERKGEEGG